MLLLVGVLLSGGAALLVQPQAWPGILTCCAGAALTALIVHRLSRRYLRSTLGRVRRVADDVAHGRKATPLAAARGDDLYKLHAAINLLISGLTDARAHEEHLHDELNRRQRLAFLGELAASVAHEVNNPLDGVQNCARILRRSLDSPERSIEMLDLIDSGLARIEQIVRRLLTLARENVIRPSEVRMADVLDGALAAVQPKLEGRAVRVVRQSDAAGDTVLIDRPLLEQVFVNLFLNAMDSMPTGGELSVAVRRVVAADARGEVCVDVADNGTGIPAEIMPRIFEPFFTTKTGGKGTGLGLAIAARIVEAHRGAISVAPRPGGGTVFTVRIPAVETGGVPAQAGAETGCAAPALVAAPAPTREN